MKKRLKKRNIENISIFAGDANNIPLKDEFFDIALVVGVMEWVALNNDGNPKKIHLSFLKDLNRILKKNGVLYLFDKFTTSSPSNIKLITIIFLNYI